MSLDKIKKMLEDLIFYYDCNIIHTFPESLIPFSVSIKKDKIQSHFQVKIIENQQVDLYADVNSAAQAIDKLINKNQKETAI